MLFDISHIIKKANLSADKQAVCEMNMALAEYEASLSYKALVDVESVMQVPANAGYNTDNRQCLTTGYEVYRYKPDYFEGAIDGIVWLITLLANQSILIYNLQNPNAKKTLLTE